jgi:hypothetical protein
VGFFRQAGAAQIFQRRISAFGAVVCDQDLCDFHAPSFLLKKLMFLFLSNDRASEKRRNYAEERDRIVESYGTGGGKLRRRRTASLNRVENRLAMMLMSAASSGACFALISSAISKNNGGIKNESRSTR